MTTGTSREREARGYDSNVIFAGSLNSSLKTNIIGLILVRSMRAAIAFSFAIIATTFAQAPPVGPHGEPAKKVALFAPKPEYPESLRKQHKGGAGLFVLHVDTETGLVSSVTVRQSTGLPLLDDTCKKSLLRWRFKPHVVAPSVVIPIRFTPPPTAQ
jgi:TonB family protein